MTRYRPEGMPGLLSNEQEAKFWLVGTGVVVLIGLTIVGIFKAVQLVANFF
jgi:hypothetical protein